MEICHLRGKYHLDRCKERDGRKSREEFDEIEARQISIFVLSNPRIFSPFMMPSTCHENFTVLDLFDIH